MGSCCGSDAPTPPNPVQVAGAQTATNVSTAIANAFLNNTSQKTPLGSLNYTTNPANDYTFTDPTTGSNYNIPRFTAEQTLSPEEQAIQGESQRAKLNLATLGANQSGTLGTLLGTDINLADAPAAGDAGMLSGIPRAATTFGDGNDYSADRARVEASLFSRLNPQLDRARTGLEQRLSDQGIRYGSTAYNDAMKDYNDQVAAQRVAVTQAGAAEQQQGFQQAAARGQFANAGLLQQLQLAQAAYNAQNQGRNQYLTERYANRTQPINEISALLSGSQVSRPTFMTTPQQQIPTTDIAGLYNQNFAQNFQNYQQQSTNQNALLGGILGGGSNILAGYLRSDRDVKKDIHRIGTVFAALPERDSKKLPIYQYAYKDDPASTAHVGPMAQDVEKIDPGAVKTIGGVKHIQPERVMGNILRAA
jgi:hypothetical protein